MAKYTTEVRSICEVSAGLDESVGYSDVDNVITKAIPKIFNFNFPIFDETYRLPLEKKILKHYYTREIGVETVGLWKLKLDTKLNEIMPYYNQLYKSALIEYNPLYDTDLTREHEGEGSQVSKKTDNGTTTNQQTTETEYEDAKHSEDSNTGSNSGTSTTAGSNHDLTVFSDTPQGGLLDVENNAYLTNATKDDKTDTHTTTDSNTASESSEYDATDEGTSTQTVNGTGTNQNVSNGNIDSTDKYIEHIYGVGGGVSYSKRIMDFRKTFLNIDMMVIDDLKDLFFLLW